MDDRERQLRAALCAIAAKRCRESLCEFSRFAFGALCPDRPYFAGRHVEWICDHLHALQRRDVRGLIVNIPPRHGKSFLISVCFPVWLWLQRPGEQILSASYAYSLAQRDAVASRRLLESPEFRALYPDPALRLCDDQNTKMRYENKRGGYRIAASVGGGAMGEGGSVRILDDPMDPEGALSETQRTSTLDWIDQTWQSRTAGGDPVEVVVMQRLHEHDVTGHYLRERTGYEHLMLPALCEDARRCHTSVKGRTWQGADPRAEGEPLCEQMRSAADLDKLRANEFVWNSQYRQSPTAKGGTIIKAEWLQYWRELPARDDKNPYDPCGFSWIFQSWDCTFKKTAGGSYVVGQLWAVRWPKRYLIDQRRGRWSFSETLAQMRDASRTWDQMGFRSHAILVEEKANGAAICDVLQQEMAGLMPRQVEGGDKAARMRAESMAFASHCVVVPDPAVAPWVREYVGELLSFPFAENDDQADATSQALSFVRESFGALSYSYAADTGADDVAEQQQPDAPAFPQLQTPEAAAESKRQLHILASLMDDGD